MSKTYPTMERAVKKLEANGWKITQTGNPGIVRADKDGVADSIHLYRNGGTDHIAVIQVGGMHESGLYADNIAQAMRLAR